MIGHSYTLCTATIAVYHPTLQDGEPCLWSEVEVFTCSDTALEWAEWKMQMIESRYENEDDFMIQFHGIEPIVEANVEAFTEDIRCNLVDEEEGGDSA